MPDAADPLLRLPLRIRQRLDAFAEALDDLSADDLPLLGARPLDIPVHEAARESADRIAAERGWIDGLAAAFGLALDWLDRRFSEWQVMRTLTAIPNPATRPEDRARVAQSVVDAVRAVALWDDLDEADRDELMGPWAALVDEPR